jgi:hypothetical protein
MPKDGDRARRRAEVQAEQIREAAARLVAERVAQGLPPTVTDPSVLARIAAILTSTGSTSNQRGDSESQQLGQPTVGEEDTLPPGDSLEQRRAEVDMIEAVSLARGVSLTSKRLDLGDGVSVQVDGVAPDHSLFCEAFAHQGPLKGGQPHKVLSDAFKLAYLGRRWPHAELLLVFSDDEAARRFRTGPSWAAKAIDAFGVKVEVVKLPDAVRNRLRKAQVRQSR